jgi:hypothetical protein
MPDQANPSPGPFTLHCSRGDLVDAFPRPCRSRDEALLAAAEILKSPKWARDMWLRLDGPNGQSWKTAAIRKRSLHVTGKRAKVGHVHPHLLRHSAGVHLAESGTPMEEIAQFLGHSDINVTRRIYARFSPDYLRKAVGALEYGSTGSARPVGKYAKRG